MAFENFFDQEYVKTAANTLKSINWWSTVCNKLQISKLALAFLQAPPSTGAIERCFSIEGFIHSSKRNRLLRERAMKISYIKYNIILQ